MKNFKRQGAQKPAHLELEELTDKILGCAITVHKALGAGHIESVYHNALVVELEKRGLRIEKEKDVKVYYEGKEVGARRIDLLVEGMVVLELKAVRDFDDAHANQLLSYLRSTGMRVGLLLNFAAPTLKIKRFLNPKAAGMPQSGANPR
ncbi:MAG: GxxExxY protein [Thermoplasmata archaeon HGW-Thermoplasmata-1]|nr:MAG: GxxExxY protein [Thermoplasmata archaeon HGW-Thermoplasmata-1]